MHQRTLKKECHFEGKGLHTGTISNMTVKPAPAGHGVKFLRTDLGVTIEALAENVSDTSRSTTISYGGASVHTIEHIMSALTGMGIDNALIEIDNIEVPILDGSARFYVEAFAAVGAEEQDAEREYIGIEDTIVLENPKSGSKIVIEPASEPSLDVTIDFNSEVLGVQKAHWDESIDYASQIAPCRTFVFFHELEALFTHNLIKGGDVDNAIVIVEHPVEDERVEKLAALFGKEKLRVEEGYLSNLQLHFPDECGRHKLLDLLGDLRLCGGFLKAHVTAYKPGHTINTKAAKAFRSQL